MFLTHNEQNMQIASRRGIHLYHQPVVFMPHLHFNKQLKHYKHEIDSCKAGYKTLAILTQNTICLIETTACLSTWIIQERPQFCRVNGIRFKSLAMVPKLTKIKLQAS